MEFYEFTNSFDDDTYIPRAYDDGLDEAPIYT